MRVTADKPIKIFKEWYGEAKATEPVNPNAMTLATVDDDGRPSARMVLLKDVDVDGFVFYTNLGSRKALELSANPHAALCFYWKTLAKQVRVEGVIELVADAEADAYFASRPKLSQLGAWASKQSHPLEGRMALEKRIAKYTAKFNVGTIPRPDFWSGLRLRPVQIELWKEEAFRLHDRTRYKRDGDGWTVDSLYP
jgi:pyridoxamine 5'-phosphate oxidase